VELREVLAALRAGWWLPVLGVLLGGALALGVSLRETPTYTSSTQLFVSLNTSGSTADLNSGIQFSQQRVASYAMLIDGPDVAQRVADRLDLAVPPEALSSQIGASALPDTVLIDVSVVDPSPQRAQQIAAAVGDVFPDYARELEAAESGGAPPVKVTVTRPASLPGAPTTPQTRRNLILGVVAGMLVGTGLAVVRRRLDRSVKTAEDAAHLSIAPVIGSIIRDDELGKRHVIERGESSPAAEAFRQLRTNLQFLNVDDPPKVIMISSAMPQEGKSTLALNLALALAEVGQRVMVVEADLRRPKITKYLDLVGGVGLTNLLAGTADLEDITQEYRGDFTVIAAGPVPPNPGELLASSQMAAIIDKLRSRYDFVLVDVPPLLPVADSSGLAARVDGVVLAVRYGTTRKEQLREAATRLHRVGARTLGVVFNIVPPRNGMVTGYGYGYGYGYGRHAQDSS
jgi:capsular exopolysaccharide synthesis family protein